MSESVFSWIKSAEEAINKKEYGRARECLTIAGELTKDLEVAERIAKETARRS